MPKPGTQTEILAADTWRFRAGIGIFILAYSAWLLVPLAALSGASAASLATLTGGNPTENVGNAVTR